MKPVAIFRHAQSEGPGYFATYLERRAIPWKLLPLDEGRAVPKDVRKYSGLVFMGGPMSVNDDLPWIRGAHGDREEQNQGEGNAKRSTHDYNVSKK